MLLPCLAQPPFCPPYWNLQSDLCQTSTADVRCHYAQFSEKNEVSVLINGLVTANYSVSRPPFWPPFEICYRICVKLLQLMCAVITHNLVKKAKSILINDWVTAIIVFHSCHFVCHLGICKRICVNLLQRMSGVITHKKFSEKKWSLHINKLLSYGQI